MGHNSGWIFDDDGGIGGIGGIRGIEGIWDTGTRIPEKIVTKIRKDYGRFPEAFLGFSRPGWVGGHSGDFEQDLNIDQIWQHNYSIITSGIIPGTGCKK